MKFAIVTIAALSIAGSAFAQSASNSTSVSGSNSGVNITNHATRNASSAIAPGLIASGLSCSGSAAVGGAGGGWGFSFGLTKNDDACDTREDARYISQLTGDNGAAKERLCDSPKTRAAFARAGRPCSADVARVRTVAAPSYARAYPASSIGRNAKLDACMKRAAKDPSVNCRVYQ